MNDIQLSILIATKGRPSLNELLLSLTSQLEPGDEVIIDVNDDAPWGHAARNRMMPRAKGTHLLFIDDDDLYYEGALEAVREGIAKAPGKVHIFRMQLDIGGYIPHTHGALQVANVSTQCVCVPNPPITVRLPQWGDRYEGDWDFIQGCCEVYGPPMWHRDVIALYSTKSADRIGPMR